MARVFYARLESGCSEGVPMNENKNAITALVFSCIMLIAPIAGAASITTFSGGDSEVSIEVRDGPDYQGFG